MFKAICLQHRDWSQLVLSFFRPFLSFAIILLQKHNMPLHNVLARSHKAIRAPLVRRPIWFAEGDEGQQLEKEFQTNETPTESDFVDIARRQGL